MWEGLVRGGMDCCEKMQICVHHMGVGVRTGAMGVHRMKLCPVSKTLFVAQIGSQMGHEYTMWPTATHLGSTVRPKSWPVTGSYADYHCH